MRIRAAVRGMISIGILAAAFSAPAVSAQRTLAEFERTYTDHCDKDLPSIASDEPLIDRIIFKTPKRGPAALYFCSDQLKQALESRIIAIPTALVFMAYKKFEPFWPAARARWGNDLKLLREELRNASLWRAIRDYPYGAMLERRYARAIVGSRIAASAGDYDGAIAMLEKERDHILEWREKRDGNTDRDFDLSLIVGVIATTVTKRDGVVAGADVLTNFLSNHGVAPVYLPNITTNQAALLAEAGKADEALAIIAPSYEGFSSGGVRSRTYRIPGSRREFAWIFACVYSLRGEHEKAAPYINTVNSAVKQPIDPYVTWTKRSSQIRIRMNKCMKDEKGLLETWQLAQEPPLSWAWLDFQTVGKPILGYSKMPAVTQSEEGKAISAGYRQLPEEYWPALNEWQSVTDNE